MGTYPLTTTALQEAILTRLARRLGKTNAEVVDQALNQTLADLLSRSVGQDLVELDHVYKSDPLKRAAILAAAGLE